MTAHFQEKHGDRQYQRGPEAPGHVAQREIRFVLGGRDQRFQRHAADGTISRPPVTYLGMHRAGIDGIGCRRCLQRRYLQMLEPRQHRYKALELRRREILALEEFAREGNDFALCRLIDGFDTHDARRQQRRVIANETGKLILGGAMADNEDFMRGLQGADHRRKIRFGVMGMPGADRSGFVVDIALPVRRLDPVFRNIVFSELEDGGLRMID